MSRSDCKQNRDPLQLVREGTSREERLFPALDPGYAPVDERAAAHHMVFAQAYSAFLNYFNADNVQDGDWQPFFSGDVSVQLALAAVQDVDAYRIRIKEYLDFLKDLNFQSDEAKAKEYLGYLFSAAATLARQFDIFQAALPADLPLKSMLQALLQSQLALALNRLISYYKADLALPQPDSLIAEAAPDLVVLGKSAVTFAEVYQGGLTGEWITDGSADWAAYTNGVLPDASVYGSGIEAYQRINHIATHNLFTSALDQFLKAYARTAAEAAKGLEASLTQRDDHQPHYALFLTFLRLFAYARDGANTLTGRHLDFYYRIILQLKEKEARPGHAHLLIELAKQPPEHLVLAGELFKAGKDALGHDAFFANDRDFVANQAQVAALMTVYRHGSEKVGVTAPSSLQQGRIFASPVANSEDGIGGELTSNDKSWHPFHNKKYQDGTLAKIDMPKAEIGFGVASHYLYLAQGERSVTLSFQSQPTAARDFKDDVVCLFSSEKGWLEKAPVSFAQETGGLVLRIDLSGADPAVVAYSAKLHGYSFATELPVLLVKLKHRDDAPFAYPELEPVTLTQAGLTVEVTGLKTAALSNDFGPVGASKPFQPFGPSPVANGSFVIGSGEMFQKSLTYAQVNVQWQSTPAPFNGASVSVVTEYLQGGVWRQYKTSLQADVTSTTFDLLGEPQSADAPPYSDAPAPPENEQFQTSSRNGFVRLRLAADFGQSDYEQALIDYIKRVTDSDPNNDGEKPVAPTGPYVTGLTLDYGAQQTIALDQADRGKFEARQALFFHLDPFGYAEQHPYLKSTVPAAIPSMTLLPQFKHLNRDDPKLPKGVPVPHEAEFYVGVAGLVPPQNLALLFQVVDGSADPLSIKPKPHIDWSYLQQNEWVPFGHGEVEDRTAELIDSGIVTLSIPRGASSDNTLLPADQYWVRAAVKSNSDSVCRLILVAAQALQATFEDQGNDPAFVGGTLHAGIIAKLAQPDADVKKVSQPFASFGGRGKEAPADFYTRVSERLRHKDRAIAQWDYERLVLEGFPQIYRVKCLNHTQYEPDATGSGIYRELAPGHVTVVTIPDLRLAALRDPLRPYTSLGLLDKISAYLAQRLSCFVRLHVRNPLFEEVQVDCKVTLQPGLDQSFYEQKVKEAITRFLSPWAFPGGGNPSFGGKVRKSVLIDFVEELPYVDCVMDFRLLHSYIDADGNARTDEVDEAAGSTTVSILVSARKHLVAAINPAEEETPGELCRCLA
ncbi:hypothetical protein Gbem_2553 [Citrifermentans bemidjiense Bem]|uniref:Uncharacterized protein n=1 Tax=Citrifermentans bemidjiense (strain ATCC BAA-1014 / DSM 16622 / JCM 12645 / Bem) TaxID=404380 RepID=B5EGS8_CITBB|nr:baseplate J/gp47 family protein [Citrifermentans bemidjiense]ACH39561.1 hypothetical protein Gbem_2553 [Citrifermentans bemidjiense Bem]